MRAFALAATLLALAACTAPPRGSELACAASLRPALQVDLYFGRATARDGEISEAEWARFLADEVTPRFPAGLSVLDVAGQYREPSGRIERERSKLLTVVVFDAPAHGPKVQSIIDAYRQRYGQNSVFRVERAVCAGS